MILVLKIPSTNLYREFFIHFIKDNKQQHIISIPYYIIESANKLIIKSAQ